jgi:cytochrome d ubiquinol oxidase subunit II
LHIPLTLMLVGIVLRGSAFAFRSFDVKDAPIHPLWERLFAGSSVLTPLLIGITVGAVASGRIALHDDRMWAVFVRPWLAPFPIAIGSLTLALFTFLAAVYLAVEAEDHALRQEFGRRAVVSAMAVSALAFLALILAKRGAPLIWESFIRATWAWMLLASTALLAVGAFVCLRAGSFRWARLCAGGEGLLILWGWALAQYPFLVPPDLTIYNSASPPPTLRLLLFALMVGAMLLFPSLYCLFRIFKDRPLFGREA